MLRANITPAQYQANIGAAQEYIAAGDAFQIVLSQRFERETHAAPFDIYRALRRLNPSPYMFYLDFGELRLIGASPEMMARVEDGAAEVRPIAGTRRRGRSEAEDECLARELLADPKERAEHVMLVDLGRNDLGRVAKFGSVCVPQLMGIEKFSHVMHIVSRVRAELRPECDAFDVLRATFPAGTLSGAPKIRAMQIIEALEGTRRGVYGGAVGYFDYTGNMDTCIAIRTIVMRGQHAYVQAGAGIVADSDPASEHQECVNKAQALAEAIRLAETALES
jgi:anthranilate synthase component 1